MSDFNSDNAKLDAALGTLAQTVTGHTTALAQKGNCQLYYQSYTGNGATSRTFTFPKQPKLVILRGDGLHCDGPAPAAPLRPAMPPTAPAPAAPPAGAVPP